MSTATHKKGEEIQSFLSGKLAQVDVRAIQNELDKLWQQASSAPDNVDHPQVIRACSCNLILFTDRDDADVVDANLLDDVVLKNPCRAILAISHPDKTPRLEAWVTARCHFSPGSLTKQICSEQITVLSEGIGDSELLSVMESLVLGDLPVFLWWTIDDISGDRIGPYLSCARRLIVDSARAPYSLDYLRNLHGIVDSTDGEISVSDLNWRRLMGIRYAIAEEFERLPLSLDRLQRIKTVKIKTCGQDLQEDDCSIQALLLVGWLASRLGWSSPSLAKDNNKKSLAVFEADHGKIDVRFQSVSLEHVAAGSVCEVELILDDGSLLSISRDPTGNLGTLYVSFVQDGKPVRELVADDSDMDRVMLVGYELEELSCDKIFVSALSSAYELIQSITQ